MALLASNGDAYVKEAAIVGLLGLESKRWWKKVEDFWEKGDIIRDT